MPILYKCNFDVSGFAYAAYGYSIGINNNQVPVSVDGIGDGSGLDIVTYNKILNLSKNLIRSNYVAISHFFPGNLNISQGALANIAVVACESNNIPTIWNDICSKFDAVIVPSYFCYSNFLDIGFPKERMSIVSHAVDLGLYKYRNCGNKDKYTFLYMNSWLYRKGWRELIECFVKTFRKNKDVRLLIKTIGPETYIRNCVNVAALNSGVEKREWPQIDIISAPMSGDSLPGFMSSADCFVSPHYGEGFGLNIANAMAIGLPCIVTGFGGNCDFCKADTCNLISHNGFQKSDKGMLEQIPSYEGTLWAKIDKDSLCQLLLKSPSYDYINKKERARKIVEKLSYNNIGKQFIDSICKMVPRITIDILKEAIPTEPERYSLGQTIKLVEL